MRIVRSIGGILGLKEVQEHVLGVGVASCMVGMPGAITSLMSGRSEISINGVHCTWMFSPKEFL